MGSRSPMVITAVAAILGMLLSIYAYHVEMSVHSDPMFKPLCDISKRISCSKVFGSRYGRGFGLVDRFLDKDNILNQPNSVSGMIFYILSAIFAFSTAPQVVTFQLVMTTVAMIGCVYLAYILVFILEDLCVVCVSTYVMNIAIFVCTIIKYRALQKQTSRRERATGSNKGKKFR